MDDFAKQVAAWTERAKGPLGELEAFTDAVNKIVVQYDRADPESVAAAEREMVEAVDAVAAPYSHNPAVLDAAEKLKAHQRAVLRARASGSEGDAL